MKPAVVSWAHMIQPSNEYRVPSTFIYIDRIQVTIFYLLLLLLFVVVDSFTDHFFFFVCRSIVPMGFPLPQFCVRHKCVDAHTLNYEYMCLVYVCMPDFVAINFYTELSNSNEKKGKKKKKTLLVSFVHM